jgi:hypothetical protein
MTTAYESEAPFRHRFRRLPGWKKTGLRIEIILGMPKYKCRFHGICRIETDESDLLPEDITACCRSKGILFYQPGGGCLIHFEKASMSRRTRRYHFCGKWFWLREGIGLSDSVCSALNQYDIHLRAGRYRLVENRRYYQVYFYTRTIKDKINDKY